MVRSLQCHTAAIAARAIASAVFLLALTVAPAHGQEGSLITSLQDEISSAARGWEQTVSNAARSLFWILASIEIGLAAIWLALQAPSLQEWFAALVRRIMFVGFFALVLDQGPSFAKAVVDSLFQIGASGGNASPADIFNAGLVVAGKMAEKIRFGLFEDNALAISAAFATIVVVIAFSLVAAIFVAIMAEMYIGLLAGMIMLGLGGSSFTKDFAIKYLVYAFSVGMKLMALVMIARIGSEVLIGLANRPEIGEQFQTLLAIAGIAVVVFVIAIYVPNIIQGVIQGVSVGNGMEVIRHGSQAASLAAGAGFLAAGSASAGMAAARSARAGGASMAGAILSGMAEGIGAAGKATGSAMKEKAIEAPGSHASSLLGLANSKLDHGRMSAAGPSSTAPRQRHRP
ncbi:P-type conjugative transfer protein TrbL [Rhizobium mesosinicum]|uniref:P-type conjugative transfer protein TrbL n=1 Tax=Rhizobium mesosinicum TaxID=335017 RepID=A0ABS7GXR7_9HYPH|nr:P-type conjugative transfer protein TrbL [Rhizobium mesosinicum]MBW9054602.1 P-type conjugative transfer protein TrbL [Rhizobium mesosinicum]